MNLIDHLPRDTYYNQALALDPEMSKALAEYKMARAAEGERFSPPMSTWTAAVGALADVWDKLEEVRATLVAVNSTKKRNDKPARYPRPDTGLAAAENEVRRERHERLADRLLPNRRRKKRE